MDKRRKTKHLYRVSKLQVGGFSRWKNTPALLRHSQRWQQAAAAPKDGRGGRVVRCIYACVTFTRVVVVQRQRVTREHSQLQLSASKACLPPPCFITSSSFFFLSSSRLQPLPRLMLQPMRCINCRRALHPYAKEIFRRLSAAARQFSFFFLTHQCAQPRKRPSIFLPAASIFLLFP